MNASPHDIDAYLASLEYEENIAILGAWAAGSRAWGTDHPNSDYDIRVVYAKPPTEYPTTDTQAIDITGADLETVSDQSRIAPEDIEITGWEAGYFVELLGESNPSAIEALLSPVPYRQHPVFEEMGEYIRTRFHVIELAKQYRSMAEHNYQKYITGDRQDKATVKRTLTVIRALMNADYVYETHAIPPLVFPHCIDTAPEAVLDPWNIEDIQSLVDYAQVGDGDEYIGNRFETTIEDRLAALHIENVDPQHHIREKDCRLSGDVLNEYMQTVLQSRLLVQ